MSDHVFIQNRLDLSGRGQAIRHLRLHARGRSSQFILQHAHAQLDALQAYGEKTLADLSCRELITFHDGFAYLAHAFDIEIVEAIEEE